MKVRMMLVMGLVIVLTPAIFGQTNGSFEDGAPCSGFIGLFAGSTAVTDWTVGGGGVDIICGYWESSDGDRNLDLNNLTPGSVSQEIETTPGLVYTITFDLSGNPDSAPVGHPWFSPNAKVVEVSAGGNAAEFTYDTAAAGNTREDMLWVSNTFTFTAVDDTTILTFTSLIPGAFGPALDNVGAATVVGAQVCHRNNGKNGPRTLNNGAPALQAHLAQGDTPGTCPAPDP